jgi:peptidyl-prolyl cis-trans isomerase C
MTVRDSLKITLREPLVHFFMAGALIFLLFPGSSDDVDARRITVSEAQVTRLATIWAQTWQRPPSPQELDGLIRDFIKEEVYYREGLRLGLDSDDAIVRRRIRAKMETIATSEAEVRTPDDQILRDWINRNPARYASNPAYSFDHVYVSGQGEDAQARAAALLPQLPLSDAADLGDPISLPRSFEATSKAEVARQFGDAFAGALATQPVGRWAGPVTSGFGLHLVHVRSVTPGATAPFATVRQQAENDWRSETRAAREAKAYQSLLNSYNIVIERPR